MRKNIITVTSLLAVLTLNIYFRCYPVFLPQLKTQARDLIEGDILDTARLEVNNKFPGYDPVIKEGLSQALFSDYLRNNKKEINKQVNGEYRRLKDRYQDESGQTYLMELDGWHWARYVDNIIRHGYPGDSIRNGRQFDEFMLAPVGSYLSWNTPFFYFCAFLYRVFSLIRPPPLLTFLFYLPLFFITIFLILLYFFCVRHWDDITAFVSCFFVGLSPIFFTRSWAGWFDTDILNLTFPLVIVWAYLTAYEKNSLKKGLLYLLLSAFLIGLFSSFWLHWWFIFVLLIIYEIYSLVNLILVRWQYREETFGLVKRHILSLILFLIFSLGCIILFSGSRPLEGFGYQFRESLTLNQAVSNSIWPNVYSTVGELRRPDFLWIVHSVGGLTLFLPALVFLLGLFLLTARNKKYTVLQREAIIVLTFWFIAMFLACLSGIRFSMFLLIPLGIALGWGISEIYLYFKKSRKTALYILLAFLLLFTVKVAGNAIPIAREARPFMDDNWHKLLTAIKEKTSEDAILNSWWDFGDWFKAVAARRVIFDGQSQNTPQAHWMAAVLLSNDEGEAIAMLRMLNNGANRAFEIIDKNFNDPFRAVMFLKRVMALNSRRATMELRNALPDADARKVAGILFNTPAEAYFIVDYTLLDKASPISFLANWDFGKVYIRKNLGRKKKEEITGALEKSGLDNKSIERLYQEAKLVPAFDLESWLSKKVIFRSGLVKGSFQNGAVLFGNGMVYKPGQKRIYLYVGCERKYKTPRSLFIFNRGRLKEIRYPAAELDYSVLVFRRKGEYYAVALDRELAESLLVRLYFLRAQGLRHFRPFLETREEGSAIRVFKINW